MSKKAKTENPLNADEQIVLKDIELLSCAHEAIAEQDTAPIHFNFDVQIEMQADLPMNLLIVIVRVLINNEQQTKTLGKIAVSYSFEVLDLKDKVEENAQKKPQLAQQMSDTVNSIALATTRGLMFANFKGTALHHAYLPVISQRQFKNTSILV